MPQVILLCPSGSKQGEIPTKSFAPRAWLAVQGREEVAGSYSSWLYLAGVELVSEAVRAQLHVHAQPQAVPPPPHPSSHRTSAQ